MKDDKDPSGIKTIQRTRRASMSRQRRPASSTSSSSRSTRSSTRGYSSGSSVVRFTPSTHGDTEDKEIMIESVLGRRQNGLHQRKRDYAPLKSDDDEFQRNYAESFPPPASIFEVPQSVFGKKEWIWRLLCVFLGAGLYLSMTTSIGYFSHHREVLDPSSTPKLLNDIEKAPLKDPIIHRSQKRSNEEISSQEAYLRGVKRNIYVRSGDNGNSKSIEASSNDDMFYSKNQKIRDGIGKNTWGNEKNFDDYVDPYAAKKRPTPLTGGRSSNSMGKRLSFTKKEKGGKPKNPPQDQAVKDKTKYLKDSTEVSLSAQIMNSSVIQLEEAIGNVTEKPFNSTNTVKRDTSLNNKDQRNNEKAIIVNHQNVTSLNDTIADANITNTEPVVSAKNITDRTNSSKADTIVAPENHEEINNLTRGDPTVAFGRNIVNMNYTDSAAETDSENNTAHTIMEAGAVESSGNKTFLVNEANKTELRSDLSEDRSILSVEKDHGAHQFSTEVDANDVPHLDHVNSTHNQTVTKSTINIENNTTLNALDSQRKVLARQSPSLTTLTDGKNHKTADMNYTTTTEKTDAVLYDKSAKYKLKNEHELPKALNVTQTLNSTAKGADVNNVTSILKKNKDNPSLNEEHIASIATFENHVSDLDEEKVILKVKNITRAHKASFITDTVKDLNATKGESKLADVSKEEIVTKTEKTT